MSFQLAHLKGARVPRVVEHSLAEGEEFEHGALLLVDANGQYAEAGANPAAVAAVALSGAGPDTSGVNPLGTKGFPPGYVQGVAISDETTFHAEYVGTLPAAPGGSYGVVKDADGRWKVNFADTANAKVKLISTKWTEAPLNKPRVLVTFLPGTVQLV
jgi:hypothetical protein